MHGLALCQIAEVVSVDFATFGIGYITGASLYLRRHSPGRVEPASLISLVVSIPRFQVPASLQYWLYSSSQGCPVCERQGIHTLPFGFNPRDVTGMQGIGI